MADKVVLEAEVKSNIGEVSQDASSLASEFKVMGVSLNDVKNGFVSMGRTAKASFATLRAGLMSTGIGALVIALGSLVTYFTQTEKGAEKLKVIMSGVNATFKVFRDRVSKVGETLSNVFNQSLLTTLKDIANAFRGITKEVKEEVTTTMDLTRRTNELVDAERKLNVETAQKRARIEELKLIAEDVTKEEGERLAKAKVAFKMEQDLLDARVKNAEEAVAIQRELNSIAQSGEEDLDALAEKEIALANIRTESATKQIELNNKVNAIKAQISADEQARADAEEKKEIERADELQKRYDTELQYEENIFQAKMAINNALGQSIGQLSQLMEEGSSAAKALALAEIATNTAVAYMQGLNVAQKASLAMGPSAAFAFPVFYASQVASILGAVNQARTVLGSVPGGGGSVPSTPATPAPQMMSGAFELTGGQPTQALRAYVLTDEMTDSQNQLANIRRRATI